jgi:hypothetical protein
MSRSPFCPVSPPVPDNKLPPHQKAMVEACKAGRLAELQKLFNEHDIKTGDDLVTLYNVTERGVPRTEQPLAAAILHDQRSVVQYLHSVFSRFDLRNAYIVKALTERMDIEMFRLVYSYFPPIVNFMFDDHMTTVLGKACEGGPQCAPLMRFLLDHGATPGGIGSYRHRSGK